MRALVFGATLAVFAISQAQAKETTITCTVAESIISSALQAGKLKTREEVINSLKAIRLYTIELTFDPETPPGVPAGIGTMRGETMPYWVTDDFIVYMTAGANGTWAENSFLDRRKGTFSLALDAGKYFPFENCTVLTRKF